MAILDGIRRGQSAAADPVQAARDFHRAVAQPGGGGLVCFFCSTAYPLDILGAELARLFAGTHLIGCTTAGEIGPSGYMDGSISGFSIPRHAGFATSTLIPGLSAFRMSEGHAAAEAALAAFMRGTGAPVDPTKTFALLLSDGMAANEEPLVAAIHSRMGNVPLVGGSAGDDLRLKRSFVYHDGRFHPDAALLTMVRTSYPFRICRTQHFYASDVKMVVTSADPVARTVSEINAEPAAVEYARIAGLDVRQLTPIVFAEHPVMVRVGGACHVRSIQRLNEDGSLTFFCAIDEGVVLTLARREDIVHNLERFFGRVRQELGAPQLVIGFDCILRSVEAENMQCKHRLSRLLSSNNVIGFCTYGEQHGAMHVNQTFTSVVIGQPAGASADHA